MPGTDIASGAPGAAAFGRSHLWRQDPAGNVGQVVYSRLIAYQPSTLSFIDLSLDAAGNLNTAGGGSGGGGAVTVADGADVAQGATADAAVVTDVAGTLSGKLRGLVKILASVWDSGNGRLNVAVQNTATVDTELPAAAALADTAANPTAPAVGAYGLLWNGATWDRAPGDKTSGVKVQSAQLPAALGGGGGMKVDIVSQTLAKLLVTADPVTFAAAQHVILDTTPVHIDDNAGSLTVDAPVATPVFVRLSDGAAALAGQKVAASSLPVVVASDQSAIPDNLTQIAGSALAAKAVPANGQGQTAIPVYTNAVQLASYVVPIDAVASGTLTANTRKDILSLEHAVSATKTVKVRSIFLGGAQTTALVGVVYWKLFVGTAATSGGTAVTPTPTRPGTAAAEVVAKTLPTIVAATLLKEVAGGQLNFATALTGFPGLIIYEWQEDGETIPITLRAGSLDTVVLAIFSNVAHAIVVYGDVTLTEE